MKNINVHLGCGTNVIPGWINYDLRELKGVTKCDLSKGIPLSDNSVQKIYSEHFIEHFSKDEGYELIKESYRVLKKGGQLRIGWSEFNRIIYAYIFHSPAHKKHILKYLKLKFGIWEEITADRLFSWGHKYTYTTRHLKMILNDIGFINIKTKRFKESDYGFDNDTRNDVVTVYLEAVK